MENSNDKSAPYSDSTVRILQIIYAIAIFIWVLLILVLPIRLNNVVGWLLLAVPIIIFLLSLINVRRVTVETEAKLFNLNYLSIGVFVIIPLITHDKFSDNTIMKIATVAMILAVFSLLDVWVPPDWVTIINHLRSILQVASLSLIIYALYMVLQSLGEKRSPILPA